LRRGSGLNRAANVEPSPFIHAHGGVRLISALNPRLAAQVRSASHPRRRV